MRRGFAALAHYVDDKIGELLEILEENELRDETIVIFTSDHGEMLGEKGIRAGHNGVGEPYRGWGRSARK